MKKLVCIALSLCFFSSCEKENSISISDKNISTNVGMDNSLIPNNIYNGYNLRDKKPRELREEEILFAKIARILANKMTSNTFKSFLQNEANKKFDGDFDILVSKNSDKKFDDFSFTELLSKNGIKIEKYPLLNLSIPLHNEKWNTENDNLLVAGWVNDDMPFTTAYDLNGKEYLLDAKKDPNLPVLVVGFNERVDEKGEMRKIKQGTVKSSNLRITSSTTPTNLTVQRGSANTLITQWNDVPDETSYEIWRSLGSSFILAGTNGTNNNVFVNSGLSGGQKYFYKVRSSNANGYSAWSNIITARASDRDDNSPLIVRRMKFTSSALQNVERWLSGAPEIRLRVIRGFSGGAATAFINTNIFEPSQRSNIENTWWNYEVSLMANGWDADGIGTVLTFNWREEDWDDNVSFSINGSYEDKGDSGTIKIGGSVSWSGDKGGDEIGETVVNFWDYKYQIYDVSGFQWDFKN